MGTARRLGRSADRLLGAIEDGVMAALLAAAACLGLLQVVLRYVFATGFDWLEPFLVMFVVYAALIGASTAVRRGLHVRLDVVIDKFSPRWRRLTRLGTNLLCLFYTVTLWWFGLQFVRQVARFGNINIESDLPEWVHYTAAPLGMALMSIRYLQEIWHLAAQAPEAAAGHGQR